MRLRGLALVVLALVVGCSRPSSKDCEEAIRNWYTLIFWEEAEQEIANAPADKRDALRAEKAKEKETKLEKGLELAINQCRGARDHDGVKCMKEAKTAAQARKCRAPKEP